jgi:sugar O-acyltransferase (sialic acid O-acetyltransferase NeuD family)
MLELYVVGAGGHGRELHAYIQDLKRAGWDGTLRGYLDDGLPAGRHGRLEVLGPIDALAAKTAHYLTAFGSNPLRRKIVERLATLYGDKFAPWTLLHPLAYVGEDVAIGPGTCIAPGVIVTAKVTIGSHCILNVKASVSHDCTIGDFVNINPAATVCGSVSIGEGAYIGAGAVVKERVSIGAWSIIGAGTVVIRDIPPNVTAVGVPAQIIKEHLPACPSHASL